MNCPKCRLDRALVDLVCRRCKYVFEEDRFLRVAPRRAAQRPWWEKMRDIELTKRLPRLRVPPWIKYVAAIVPGAGHILTGRAAKGLILLGLAAMCAMFSLMHFSRTSGQMMFGFAVSVHAFSIFDLTPFRRSHGAVQRAVAMGLILAATMTAYWPLAIVLSNKYLLPIRLTRNDQDFVPSPLGPGQLITMGILFALSIAFASWVSRRLSAAER
jgi:hypothetical protein